MYRHDDNMSPQLPFNLMQVMIDIFYILIYSLLGVIDLVCYSQEADMWPIREWVEYCMMCVIAGPCFDSIYHSLINNRCFDFYLLHVLLFA